MTGEVSKPKSNTNETDMSYIDPDALHGAMTDLNTAITDNADTLTANGVVPATLQANLKIIQDDLGGKKGIRDKAKTALTNAQQDYALAATNNYTKFSDLIDAAAGGLGKHTPEGQRVLDYRKHLNASHTHPAAPAPAPTAPAP
jgi:hypothetical protein